MNKTWMVNGSCFLVTFPSIDKKGPLQVGVRRLPVPLRFSTATSQEVTRQGRGTSVRRGPKGLPALRDLFSTVYRVTWWTRGSCCKRQYSLVKVSLTSYIPLDYNMYRSDKVKISVILYAWKRKFLWRYVSLNVILHWHCVYEVLNK